MNANRKELIECEVEQLTLRIIDLLKSARQPMFLVCVSDQVRRLSQGVRKPARSETARVARRARAI